MEDFRKKTSESDSPQDASYPASIQKMSEKWREIRQADPQADSRTFLERNFLKIGIGIGLLILIMLIVFGGFAFLVWNAR